MKDLRIVAMLSLLEQALGPGTFDVVDHWDADLTAVGVACPSKHSRLVYIRAMAEDNFEATLEDVGGSKSELPYVETGRYCNLDLDALTEIVRFHLKRTSSHLPDVTKAAGHQDSSPGDR